MPSPPTVVAAISNPARTAPALSSTPPATTTLSDHRYNSLSPKSVAPRPAANSTATASRNHYYSSASNNRSAANTAHPNSQHIASTIALPAQTFSAASLPRTSSLLPPPRIAPESSEQPQPHPHPHQKPTFQNPFNAAQPIVLLNDLDPPPPRLSSRASSVGGPTDGIRNLNRWSASTTSSRASPTGHQKSSSFGRSRNTSVDIVGGVQSSPRKLHKSPPAASGATVRPPASSRVRQESPVTVPPFQALPQIASLPSLERDFQGGNSPASLPPPRPQREAPTRSASDDAGFHRGNGSGSNPGDTSVLSDRISSSTGFALPGSVPQSTKMLYNPNGENGGHSRSRSGGTRSNSDTTSQSKSRDRSGKHPSQKAMLSKALQKANMAVQLDNAQNTEGARRAYSEACELLQQVLARTAGEEDRKKLEAIYKTYTSRIEELDQQIPGPPQDEKALPRRPPGNAQPNLDVGIAIDDDEEAVIETATATRVGRDRYNGRDAQTIPSYSVAAPAPRRKPSTDAAAYPGVDEMWDGPSSYLSDQQQQSPPTNLSRPPRGIDNGLALQPTRNTYLPPPLSPRRPYSPAKPAEQVPDDPPFRGEISSTNRLAPAPGAMMHQRGLSHESVSWLDPIDESGGSSASSVHSRSSSLRIRRKHIRPVSGNTEAEFDAALDDAIEAAYDEGYEPDNLADHGKETYEEQPEDAVAKALRRVQLARERVRESEREALELANEREKRLRLQQQLEDEELRQQQDQSTVMEDFYDGNDSEEEERLLEEMTQGYAIEHFAFGPQSKAAVPRESDSSWATSRTFHSSMGSNPPTATTILTTVSEDAIMSSHSKPPTQRPPPPPTQALPLLPGTPGTPLSAASQSSFSSNGQGVRSRRLSGQNAKQLKIETTKLQPPTSATGGPTSTQPKTAGYIVQQRQALSAGPNRTGGPQSARPAPSPVPGANLGDPGAALATPPFPTSLTNDAEGRSGSPSVSRPLLRKNFSSSSLKSLRSRNLSMSNIDDASDLSPGTPLSTRLPALPNLPPPLAAAFKDRVNSTSTGGLYLFESDFHSPQSPGSPDPLLTDSPAPLEPCPTEVMLRPFWLMRCLYQTLCHPRGGYLSSKLFVPRDVWRVKGVKLKNVEDKISNCDLLTAALQNLSRVDTCDADAVLEEMQSLEGLLEQVQAALTRKLGSDVGVQGASSLFKEASGVDSSESAAAVPRSASVGGKGSSFSWRRLRSKNSSAALASGAAYSGKGGSGGSSNSNSTTPIDGTGGKDTLLPSLPMTNHPARRVPKRDVGSAQFGGPNAQYMASLAKLFDAAQTVDQIARQVEDPGLRHADKTQVGLELCTRHAAEFFGFYICRFVLTDLMMLLDKFIKRGSEWVLV